MVRFDEDKKMAGFCFVGAISFRRDFVQSGVAKKLCYNNFNLLIKKLNTILIKNKAIIYAQKSVTKNSSG